MDITVLKAYRKDLNSVHYTNEVIFCCFTKKQIFQGFAVIEDQSIYVYDTNSFIDNLDSIIGEKEFINIVLIISNAPRLKKIIKKERGKMNVRLRYEIIKRDNFRCQSCGVTSKESTLHVDHKTPVSKGGKTEVSNLHTLCRTCNIGKSNVH